MYPNKLNLVRSKIDSRLTKQKHEEDSKDKHMNAVYEIVKIDEDRADNRDTILKRTKLKHQDSKISDRLFRV